MRYSSGQVWAVTAFAALVYLALVILGVASGGNVLDIAWNLSSIVPLLVIGGWLFELRGWRWQRLHPHLVSTPVVIGTWRGIMQSDWIDPDTGKPIPPRTVYLAISQSAVSLSVRLLTDESTSDLLNGQVAKQPSGYPVLAYTYRNEPALSLQRTRSQIHHGAAMINIVGDPATKLDGVYWTDRRTTGTLTFGEHSPTISQTYEQATQLAYGQPRPVGLLG